MKRIVSLVVCFALIVGCTLFGLTMPMAAAATNLIVNGDFESDELTNWQWTGASATNIDKYAILGGTSPITVHTEDNGNKCLMIPEKKSGETYSTYDRYYYKAGASKGKTYRLTFRYKGTGLRLYFHTTYCSSGKGVVQPKAVNDWTTYTHTFTTSADSLNNNFLFALGHTAAAGTVYLDDLVLKEYVEPTGIGFENPQITVGKGGSLALPLIATPLGADLDLGDVTWTCDNTSVLSMANGVVTGLDYGVAYVTATLGDYTASCTVIVDPYTPVVIGDFEGTVSGNWAWDHATYGIITDGSPMTVKAETNGNHYLEIPSTGASYTRYYKNAPVREGRRYMLQFRYKGDNMRVYCSSSIVVAGAGSPTIAAADGWTTYRYYFTVRTEALANTNFVFGFGHMGTTTETACLDDVTLCEVSPFTDLIVDGDLESEKIASNWSKFEETTANFARVPDPADASNTCYKVTGARRMNYTGMSDAKANTTYKLTFRGKGVKRFVLDLTYSIAGQYTVLGTENYTIPDPAKTLVYITPASATQWETYSIIFTTKETIHKSYMFYAGGIDSLGELYMDDFSLTELGSGYVCEGLNGGSLALDGGETISGQLGKTVTATVTANEGYMLVPGSLRYTTTSGLTQRILNKNTTIFGEGKGDTFAFVMPAENVRVLADFVKTDSTDFAWGTVGTTVRYNGETMNGIRFLTRINTTAFDADAAAVYYTYNGDSYQLKELGLLLKRASNANELTYSNADLYASEASDKRIWKSTVYTKESNLFRLTDHTETYLDYTIAMTTDKPSEEFSAREYTARGYMVLERNGTSLILYANERSDSINSTLERMSGQGTDDVFPENPGEEEPVEPDVVIPSDDQDYTNADLKILSIGNSYSQDAQRYLAAMAASQGKLFKCVNLYKAGCALKTHYEGWVNNECLYNYELSGQENLSSSVSLKAVLQSDTFDVITLQSSSWASMSYSNYQPYLNDLIAILKQYQPNATIYLHQTWAYGDDHSTHDTNTTTTGGSMATMWEKIETAYNSAANETGLALIPSGEAVYNAQLALNARGLGESIQRDQSHVSKTWGRYLLARVWYQTLTGDIPDVTLSELNTSVSDDAALEALIKQAAADAFAEYPLAA